MALLGLASFRPRRSRISSTAPLRFPRTRTVLCCHRERSLADKLAALCGLDAKALKERCRRGLIERPPLTPSPETISITFMTRDDEGWRRLVPRGRFAIAKLRIPR